MGNWFGKSKRGLIMGVWNAHTSVGNILGSLLASAMLRHGYDWGGGVRHRGAHHHGGLLGTGSWWWHPDAGHPSPHGAAGGGGGGDHGVRSSPRSTGAPTRRKPQAAGFVAALKIPGVITFSLCLFFTKLVAYTFLYWLPFYIERTEIGGVYLTAAKAGELSTPRHRRSGGRHPRRLRLRSFQRAFAHQRRVRVSLHPRALHLPRVRGSSMGANVFLMMLAGMLVNGPYALITTAVSADLGAPRA